MNWRRFKQSSPICLPCQTRQDSALAGIKLGASLQCISMPPRSAVGQTLPFRAHLQEVCFTPIIRHQAIKSRPSAMLSLRQKGADLREQIAWTIGLADVAVAACRKSLVFITGQRIGRNS